MRTTSLASVGRIRRSTTLASMMRLLPENPNILTPEYQVDYTAGCGDIDPCRSPCTCERLSTPSTEGYARIMLRRSTTLKTAVYQHFSTAAAPPCQPFSKSYLASPRA